MFSKFSVKKPMTVLVGVVIAIVLGIVAFSRMTPAHKKSLKKHLAILQIYVTIKV